MEKPFQESQIFSEQSEQIREQLSAEAAKHGLNLQQYMEQLKIQSLQQRSNSKNPHNNKSSHEPRIRNQIPLLKQDVPVQAESPKPEAIALAAFLRSQNLKTRACILQEKRKDMFKGKIFIPSNLRLKILMNFS